MRVPLTTKRSWGSRQTAANAGRTIAYFPVRPGPGGNTRTTRIPPSRSSRAQEASPRRVPTVAPIPAWTRRPPRPRMCCSPPPTTGCTNPLRKNIRLTAQKAVARPARPGAHRDLGQRNPHAGSHRGYEPVHLPVELDLPRHIGAQDLERATVVVEMHARGPGDEAVGKPGGNPLGEGIHAPAPPSADDIEPLPQLGQQPRHVGGGVLEGAVRGDHHIPPRLIETGGEGRGLAEVGPQPAPAHRRGPAY